MLNIEKKIENDTICKMYKRKGTADIAMRVRSVRHFNRARDLRQSQFINRSITFPKKKRLIIVLPFDRYARHDHRHT